MAGQNISNN